MLICRNTKGVHGQRKVGTPVLADNCSGKNKWSYSSGILQFSRLKGRIRLGYPARSSHAIRQIKSLRTAVLQARRY